MYWPNYADEAIDKRGALQDRAELAGLLAILEGEMPSTAIEIGTWAGGLTWALMQVPTMTTVITVDRELRPGPFTEEILSTRGVHYVRGDSRVSGTRQLVAPMLPPEGADVLVIDGGHDYRTVEADLANWVSLVDPRGLVVMHDTQGYPGAAVVEVRQHWAKLRARYRSLELVATPGGPGGTGILWMG